MNCPKCEEVQIDPRDAYYHTIGGRHLCKTCYLEERDANRPMTQSDLMRQIADLQRQLVEREKEIERLKAERNLLFYESNARITRLREAR